MFQKQIGIICFEGCRRHCGASELLQEVGGAGEAGVQGGDFSKVNAAEFPNASPKNMCTVFLFCLLAGKGVGIDSEDFFLSELPCDDRKRKKLTLPHSDLSTKGPPLPFLIDPSSEKKRPCFKKEFFISPSDGTRFHSAHTHVERVGSKRQKGQVWPPPPPTSHQSSSAKEERDL